MMHQTEISTISGQIAAFRQGFSARSIEKIYFVSCGGSLATISFGRCILDQLTAKVHTALMNAAEFIATAPPSVDKKTLVILNSQSGGTAETVAAARLAKERGALTLSFTTAPDSLIERESDHTVYYYDNPLDPYPTQLTIFPDVCQAAFAILDVLEGTVLFRDFEVASGRWNMSLTAT